MTPAPLAFASFLGAAPEDLVFVPNATAAVNAVLRSLSFEPGDELLLTNHTYAACRKTADFVAERSGARVVVAHLPFPCIARRGIIAPILSCVSPRTRLALLDHVTSPTALVLPIARTWSANCALAGSTRWWTAPMRPAWCRSDLSDLGAAYYTGNAHKWLCAPKGAAFLHVRRDRQSRLHPTVISHGYTAGFHAEFDWTGTFDPTPWLCSRGAALHGRPSARRLAASHVGQSRPALQARSPSAGCEAPCPETMIGSMASLPLPHAPARLAALMGWTARACIDWFRERGIETWIHPNPVPLLRISAQLYNRSGSVQAAREVCSRKHSVAVEPDRAHRARLSTFDTAMVVFSLVVGIGIFRTPAIVAGAAGSSSLSLLPGSQADSSA